MLLTEIKTAVTDRYTIETITSGRLERFIAAGVRYYSRWNPLVKDSHFHTVAEQLTYTVATDCILVLEVYYFPGGDPLEEAETVALSLYDTPAEDRHMGSHAVIDQINTENAWRGLTGFWEEERADHRVRLWPEPTGDVEVKYRYAAGHALNVGGTGYDTIPAEDLEIIANLTLAEILWQKSIERSTQPDYTLGQMSIRRGRSVENTSAVVAELRNGVREKYGGSPVVAAP
jgi:hypothetical protein